MSCEITPEELLKIEVMEYESMKDVLLSFKKISEEYGVRTEDPPVLINNFIKNLRARGYEIVKIKETT